MFITHGDFLRRNMRWILGIVLAILIPGFVALFTNTGGSVQQDTELPTIQGKPVNRAEFTNARASVLIQQILTTGGNLPRSAEFQDLITQAAVTQILMLQKAREFGIRVSESDSINQARDFPLFKNDQDQFDPDRYRQVIIFLNNFGISENQLERFVRERFVLTKLQTFIESTATVTPDEVSLAYAPMHEKNEIETVELDQADYSDSIEITPEQVQAFYEENKESFRRPAQMKVRYAYFSYVDSKALANVTEAEVEEYFLANEEKYGEENESVSLVSKSSEIREELVSQRSKRIAGDRATELSVMLVPEPGKGKLSLAEAVEKFGVEIQETDFFGSFGKVEGVEAGPQFNKVAFSLTAEQPHSDPIPGTGGYYVLEYLDKIPSEIKSFEEAKEQASDGTKRRLVRAEVERQGQEILTRVNNLLAQGKKFNDACSELGLKATPQAAFAVADEEVTIPSSSRIKQAVLGMKIGSVSELITTPNGGLFFYLKGREAADPEKFAEESPALKDEILARKKRAIFSEWVDALQREEQVDFRRLSQPVTTQPIAIPTS